jgi:N-acetylglucosaminyldiphosphoundecaprenol N-acetyl-beta-D-mannosaminyltransferase
LIQANLPDVQRQMNPADWPAASELRDILDLRFWDVDLARAARFLVDKANAGTRLHVYFVNAHCVNVAARDPAYASLLAECPLLFADGAGLALAGRLSGVRLQNNVNGTDLFPEICRTAAALGTPIALLGSRPGVARACADRMEEKFPGLQVAWTGHGYLTDDEEQAKLDELNLSGARILFVAKGVPAQEHWIAANSGRLAPPVVLGVGALLDFYSGSISRAPAVIRELRLEWLYRLLREPRRLAGRYLLGNPAFVARAVARRMFRH